MMGLFGRYPGLWVAPAVVAASATVVGVLVEAPAMFPWVMF